MVLGERGGLIVMASSSSSLALVVLSTGLVEFGDLIPSGDWSRDFRAVLSFARTSWESCVPVFGPRMVPPSCTILCTIPLVLVELVINVLLPFVGVVVFFSVFGEELLLVARFSSFLEEFDRAMISLVWGTTRPFCSFDGTELPPDDDNVSSDWFELNDPRFLRNSVSRMDFCFIFLVACFAGVAVVVVVGVGGTS